MALRVYIDKDVLEKDFSCISCYRVVISCSRYMNYVYLIINAIN